MATLVIESSSDEDDDIYLNSVAKLKALRSQKQKVVPQETEEEIMDVLPESPTPPEVHRSPVQHSVQRNVQPSIQSCVQPSVQPCVQPRIQPCIQPSIQPRVQPRPIEICRSPIRSDIIVLDPDFSPPSRIMTRSAVANRGRSPRGSPRSRGSCRDNTARRSRGRGRGTLSQFYSNDDSLLDEDSDLEIVSLELSEIEDDNYEIDIKVLWRSKDLHRLSIKKNQSFQKVFQYFADLEDVTVREISITKHEKAIKEDDTPASVALSVIDILEGGVVKKPTNSDDEANPDARLIKVQTTSKKSLSVTLMKHANLGIVFEKCAQELGVERSKMKLYFDGEVVEESDTPDSLDIEDEACFDLRISS